MDRTEIAAGLRYRLMMITVHVHLRAARQPADKAVFGDTNHVASGRFVVVLVMNHRVPHDRRNVLHE